MATTTVHEEPLASRDKKSTSLAETSSARTPLREVSPADPSVGSFVNLLSQTLAAANAYLILQLSQAGLKELVPSHGDILMALFSQKTITMQELSEKIHRDPSTITVLVKKLVVGGYVQTQKSSIDKRRTEVSLTSKGKSLRSAFDTISANLVKAQMEGIDAEAFAATCSTLDQVRSNFSAAVRIENKGAR